MFNITNDLLIKVMLFARIKVKKHYRICCIKLVYLI